ncbi:MAG: polysaccharide biosynthesis protein [Cyclobacteriaceae bacterium]
MLKELISRLTILPRWIIICLDLITFIFSFLLGFLLRFNFDLSEVERYLLFSYLPVVFSLFLFSTLITRNYSGIVRYTGIEDAVRIFYTCTLNLGLLFLINLLWHYNSGKVLIPASVLIIASLTAFIFLLFYRLLVKALFQYYRTVKAESVAIAIYGTNSTGLMTSSIINQGTSGKYRATVFFEDESAKIGKQIQGIPIHNFSRDFESVIRASNIKELIIAVRDIPFEKKNEIIEQCFYHHVRIKSVPPVENWVHGELTLNQITEITIEDLLGREVIRVHNPMLTGAIKGKVICVTGAAGSIGSELCRQILSLHPAKLVMIDQAESALYDLQLDLESMRAAAKIIISVADITNADRIRQILEETRPQTIFHAAAYKHVPMMERNPTEAVEVNVLGTKILADQAVKCEVETFVMVSTDKAINPTSIMGCSKRMAEIYVQALDRAQRNNGGKTHFITTRFGNVVGSSGSVVPIFQRQIRSGGPVTVTHKEVTRYFMSISESCRLVLEASVMGNGGEIFIFDMGKPVKIIDLARKMIKLSGLEPDIDVKIQITGLREGEKLFEELLHHSENTIKTHHPKIMKARVQEYDFRDIDLMIGLVEDLINDRNELKLVALMKEIVPEFKSNYSRFQVLDR